jgi:predicted aldo/keto reductase-like oxidoreductase
MPCKYGVDIPAVFAAYNKCVNESNIPDLNGPKDSKFNKKKRAFLATYNNMVPEGSRADRCIECGACNSVCPQKLKVSDFITSIGNLVKELEK